MNSEKGQTFPLALVVLAVGSLVISPFLGHASSMLTGSRIYGQAITEQYSCDAGIEWALWKLKPTLETGEPLTTSLTYVDAPLLPIPSEINSSSFPTTKIRFIGGGEVSEEQLPAPSWNTDPNFKYFYSLDDMAGPGTATLVIETEVGHLMVFLDQSQEYNKTLYPPDSHTVVLSVDPADYDFIRVQTPSFFGLVTMTVTYTYHADIYDIEAQKDNTIITARAKASYLGVGVISWQVE